LAFRIGWSGENAVACHLAIKAVFLWPLLLFWEKAGLVLSGVAKG
jgi:hypothetical protein